jgi:hypothetical protein
MGLKLLLMASLFQELFLEASSPIRVDPTSAVMLQTLLSAILYHHLGFIINRCHNMAELRKVCIGAFLPACSYSVVKHDPRFPLNRAYRLVFEDFSCSVCAQTSSETHPASNPMGTGGPFRGKARNGRDAVHSPHLVPRSRMSRSYSPYPLLVPAWRSGTALLFTYRKY